jgi:vacuolar iron transporter family protein
MYDRIKVEERFLSDEILDREVYLSLSEKESNPDIKRLLKKLSEAEDRHAEFWRSLIGKRGKEVRGPALMRLTMLEMLAVRRLLGIAFLVKFLERHENEGIKAYARALSKHPLGGKNNAIAKAIIEEEEVHEKLFASKADKYKGDLKYTQSIILGLNDGLVEILAVVAGLATVANTSFIVVILGLIAGISGTLSMAGGAYLSLKSENLVEEGLDPKAKPLSYTPKKAAYYCGFWYFIGSLLSVLPFAFGIGGITGVLIAILLVSTALTVASSIIAVISGTSTKARAFEMLVISLGAAFVTILFGTFAKLYFGVSI